MAQLKSGTTIGGNIAYHTGNLPSSTPTTAQVLSATAGASAGAVGTYVMARRTDAGTVGYNSTRAGSGLRPSSSVTRTGNSTSTRDGYYTGSPSTTLSGTWRAMGASSSLANNDFTTVTLWLRIS